MREIYSQILNCEENRKCTYAVGIAGDIRGEKLLYIDDRLVYKTGNADTIMTCEDEVLQIRTNGICEANGGQVFVESFGVMSRVIICGAGTVGQELVKLGKLLGLHVIVLEDRKEYADKAIELGADEVLCMEFDKGLKTLEEKDSDYYVVVTREHKFDKVCLEKIIMRKHVYVGMMASKNRARILKEALIKEGSDTLVVEEIRSPIGLKIKAETPAEIAVSIYAEIIQCRNEKKKSDGFSKELLKEILALPSDNKMILATIVRRNGSAPRDVGTKMLIHEDGRLTGSIGGGWIEANALEIARDMFVSDKRHALYETDRNSKDATLCGGYETIYLEMV